MFLIKFNDPPYIKNEKLELLIKCAACMGNRQRAEFILQELHEYAHDVDIDFVKKSIRSIGRIALLVPDATNNAVRHLASLLDTQVTFVVEEVIIVLRDIFRKYPQTYEGMVNSIMNVATCVEDAEAKASLVWIMGECVGKNRLRNQYLISLFWSQIESRMQRL